MDAATVVAVLALLVACIALLVASAQVIQQYFQTGQLIRLCDSVVFGPMPGQGRRVWQTSQFRFRIMYAVPQISILSSIWPDHSPFVGSFARGQYLFENVDFSSSSTVSQIDTTDTTKSMPGEASWVSFCRMISGHCATSIRYDLKEYDADRCPGDLPNVPMQVSMRDVIVLAIFAGMKCVMADFKGRNIMMHGKEGTIMTSQHPVLGPVLRYTDRAKTQSSCAPFPYLGRRTGYAITTVWIVRASGRCHVVRSAFDTRQRRIVQKRDGTWIRYTRGATPTTREATHVPDPKHERRPRYKVVDEPQDRVPTFSSSTGPPMMFDQDGEWGLMVESLSTEEPSSDTTLPPDDKFAATPGSAVHDAAGEPHANNAPTQEHHRNSWTSSTWREANLRERIQVAQEQHEARRAKAKAVAEDQRRLEDLMNRGYIPSPHKDGPFMITYPLSPPSSDENEATKGPSPPTQEDLNAEQREQERLRKREERDEARRDRMTNHNRSVIHYGAVDCFWLSQINISVGPWATNWHGAYAALECRGAMMVLLEALLAFYPHPGVLYVDPRNMTTAMERSFRTTAHWLLSERHSYPSYASNARGGVIADGLYYIVSTQAFKYPIPTVDLLYSYDWQVDDAMWDEEHNNDLTLELVRLDAWLSYVGRMDEIVNGRHRLLEQTPAMVAMLLDEFQLDFMIFEQSATDGGLQEIQALTANVMDFLQDEELSEAEQLFVLVACLRTIKVCQCVENGQSTEKLLPFLHRDLQAYLI